MQRIRREDWDRLLQAYLEGGETVAEFAKRLGINRLSVYAAARRAGIDITRERSYTAKRRVDFTPEQASKFEGNLLGDSSLLYKNAQRKSPVHIHSCKHREYVEYLTQTLPQLDGRPIWHQDIHDPRTGKTYPRYWTQSLASWTLEEARQRWYPNGKKRVPRDLKLNEHTMLHWFLDDGSRTSSEGRGINLATDGFDQEDCEFLRDLVEIQIGIPARLHRNDRHLRMYFPVKYVQDFLEFIGPSPVDCYAYKWHR